MSNGHSTIGPSSAERWLNCPGSVALSAPLPPSPASEYAAEGTVAHALAEELVSGKIDQLALASRIGDKVQQEGFTIEITDEMIEAAVEYNDLIDEDFKQFHLAAGKGKSVEVHHHSEIRVQAKSISEDLWGTADYLLFQKGRKLIVYDFKYGKGVEVEAAENKQMAIYAIAAMDTLAGPAYDEVELVIVQPRTHNSVRRWTAPKEWLEKFRIELKTGVDATREKNARIAAGKWCRWCPAQSVCPAVYKKVQEQAMADFSVVPDPVAPMPPVAALTPEQLAQALLWEGPIEAWFKSIRARALDMLAQGLDVPGYKLVDGRSFRKFIDERKVVEHFAPVIGEEKMYEPKKLLSPAKLEKLVGKGKLDEFTEKTAGAKAIARNEDWRPVARSSAQDDFSPTEQKVIAEAAVEIMKDMTHTPDGPVKQRFEEADLAAQLAELAGEPVLAGKGPMWPQ